MQQNQQTDCLSVQISEKLANLAPPSSESFIFKVHKQLRCINEKSYEPEIIGIGPYHHRKPNLLMMEEHKLRYLKQLLQQKGKDNADEYITALRPLELDARRCYAEPITLKTGEFIEMLLLDGCFVIQVIRKFETNLGNSNKVDPIFQRNWIVLTLQRDLMLFENQLPFFILCKLFDMIEAPNSHERFINLALHFFSELLPGNGYREQVDANPNLNIKHLLGLIHSHWLPSYVRSQEPQLNEEIQLSEEAESQYTMFSVPNATELLEAGVKIKKAERGSLFDITFENGTIRLPPLRIEDRTETFLRNLIAYEQYSPDIQFIYILDYVVFMSCLIDSLKDVEIFCRFEIFKSWLGDKDLVLDIFNKIGTGVVGPGENFHYAEIFSKINKHCEKRWYKWLAKLKRDYFNGPWAIISVVAAFVLLVLTSAQAFFTVFPR